MLKHFVIFVAGVKTVLISVIVKHIVASPLAHELKISVVYC